MEKFIREANIAHYVKQLKTETEPEDASKPIGRGTGQTGGEANHRVSS
jgi:hypothetical protein